MQVDVHKTLLVTKFIF